MAVVLVEDAEAEGGEEALADVVRVGDREADLVDATALAGQTGQVDGVLEEALADAVSLERAIDCDGQEIGDGSARLAARRLVEAEQGEAAGDDLEPIPHLVEIGQDARVAEPGPDDGPVVPQVAVDIGGDVGDPHMVRDARSPDHA